MGNPNTKWWTLGLLQTRLFFILQMKVGDEVDIVKGISEENPDLIVVSKIEVLGARPSGDFILLTLRRTKTTLVPNFEEDPWFEKPPTEPDSEKEKDLG